jgi:hypothetical protein
MEQGDMSSTHADGFVPEFGSTRAGISAAKLREYCQACHAVGNLRFIWSASDQELWNYIFTVRAPNRKILWAEAITEVLSWPGDQAPPATPIMNPAEGRDWMPKGGKRATFAAEHIEGMTLRRYILKALDEGLNPE